MQKGLGVGIVLLVAFVAIRLIVLPLGVKFLVDRELQNNEQYKISFENIEINCLSGYYAVKDIKINGDEDEPLLQADAIKFKVLWREMLKGRLAGALIIRNPQIDFFRKGQLENTHGIMTKAWMELAEKLVVVPLDQIICTNGRINFQDLTSYRNSTITATDIHLVAINLQEERAHPFDLPASIYATASAHDGEFVLEMNFDAKDESHAFNLKAELRNLNLHYISDYLAAYGYHPNVEGVFSAYTQVSNSTDKVTGFVRPLLEGVSLTSYAKTYGDKYVRVRNPFAKPLNQIPLQEFIENSRKSLWSVVAHTLHHAFIQALLPVIRETSDWNDESVHSPRMNPTSKEDLKRREEST